MCILHRISPICNNILFTYQLINKSSAVAEMGDRLTTIDMAKKWESAVRELGPHLTQCGLGQGVPPSLPSGILIYPTVWPQYTNIAERQNRQTVR